MLLQSKCAHKNSNTLICQIILLKIRILEGKKVFGADDKLK